MAIRRTETDTGIYQETRTTINGADMEATLRNWCQRCKDYDPLREVDRWLSELDAAAVRIIETQGGTIHKASTQGIRIISYGVSGKSNPPAPPSFADAAKVIHGIDEIRASLKHPRRKDIPSIVAVAIQLAPE